MSKNQWCSFLEKFERISNKIVKVLARLAPLGSLLQRGAPTRRASVIFFARDFSLASLEQGKDFIVSLPHPPVRGHGISLYLFSGSSIRNLTVSAFISGNLISDLGTLCKEICGDVSCFASCDSKIANLSGATSFNLSGS